MKKALGVVFAGMMSLACAACGGPKEETAVCTLELEVGVTYEITLEAENDIVQTMTQVTTVSLNQFPEEEVELLKENIDIYREMYKDFEGVEYSFEIIDEIMYETIVIDMTDADTLEDLRENDLLPIEGEANKISLDATVENLESLDWEIEMK